jgi:hypothetical protein
VKQTTLCSERWLKQNDFVFSAKLSTKAVHPHHQMTSLRTERWRVGSCFEMRHLGFQRSKTGLGDTELGRIWFISASKVSLSCSTFWKSHQVLIPFTQPSKPFNCITFSNWTKWALWQLRVKALLIKNIGLKSAGNKMGIKEFLVNWKQVLTEYESDQIIMSRRYWSCSLKNYSANGPPEQI